MQRGRRSVRRWLAGVAATAVVAVPLVAQVPVASAAEACAPAWAASSAYAGGSVASYSGANYKASWWTQGETPGTQQWGAWKIVGPCGTDPTGTTGGTTGGDPTGTTGGTTGSTGGTTGGTTGGDPTGADPGTPISTNPQEKCRPDGLAVNKTVDVPYCDVYDEAGREKLPNGLDRRVIGYFTSWRTGAGGTPSYLASDIPWTKLSHVNYAFAHVGPDSKISVNAESATSEATGLTFAGAENALDPTVPYKGHFNQLTKFKKQHPGVRTLVSVGGWAETGGYLGVDGNRVASGGFYALDTQAEYDAFAASAVAMVRTYGFDGIDIDYEYPTSNVKAGNPDDFQIADAKRGQLWKNYEQLMKTTREALDKAAAQDGEYYLLTIAAPASGWLLRGMEVFQVMPYLDYVNVMSYDLHGTWNDFVGGNGALFDDGKDGELAAAGVYGAYDGIGYLNADWAAHYFRGAVQAGRINIGVPFYTRGWTNVQGGTNGLWGKAALPDQTKCPPGTGPSLGGTSKCGNGAGGIDNIWYDVDKAGAKIPAGGNPIWHMLNLQNGKVGSYAASYGAPTGPLAGTYQHQFDPVTKTEWWWNAQTKSFISGDSDQAIQAKADYVVAGGYGGLMIWELAGDYDLDAASGEYGMGDSLVTRMHSAFSTAAPYGAAKSKTATPAQAIDLGVSFSEFALGDNNYPINPKVTFANRSTVAIPAGATISFDFATTTSAALGEQNGWGITTVAGHSGNNVGGLKGDLHSATLKVPAGGIPAGGSAFTKLSWRLPMAQISNVRVTIGANTYATTYDHPRGVKVVNPVVSGGSTGGTAGGTPGGSTGSTGGAGCTAAAWASGTAYNGGAQVTHAGHRWSARYWTQGNTPVASDWGPWKDEGAC